MKRSQGSGVNPWKKKQADLLRMSLAEQHGPNPSVTTSVSCPPIANPNPPKKRKTRDLNCPTKVDPSKKRKTQDIKQTFTDGHRHGRDATALPLSQNNEIVAPKNPLLHILDLKLDKISCEKDADEIPLEWVNESGGSIDLTEIPVNPAEYDALVLNALPFHFDDNILLAVHTVHGIRKHLWFCLAGQQLFWLIGCVPDRILTWRHKMLRRGKFVSSKPLYIHSSLANNKTIFFKIDEISLA
jgi:hypothetical protein